MAVLLSVGSRAVQWNERANFSDCLGKGRIGAAAPELRSPIKPGDTFHLIADDPAGNLAAIRYLNLESVELVLSCHRTGNTQPS